MKGYAGKGMVPHIIEHVYIREISSDGVRVQMG